MFVQYAKTEESVKEPDPKTWIAQCSHRLRARWRTVDLQSLEEVAKELWDEEELRSKSPDKAAEEWLKRGIPTL